MIASGNSVATSSVFKMLLSSILRCKINVRNRLLRKPTVEREHGAATLNKFAHV